MISIIIPVYKTEKYLHRCIGSILTQTCNDWELLLIDDGSPDKSGEICDEYAKNDERIKVIHKKNGGVSSARNAGLDVARGQWVVFVDSDDWCEENYLCDFLNTKNILHEDCVVLQGRINEVDGKVVDNLVLKECSYKNVSEAMLENDLLTFGAPYCKLYSNILIQKYGIRFPEGYSYGEDTTFFFRVLSVVKEVITTSKCNYHYVDAIDGSLSKKDHDFEPLAAFLNDSMELIKRIDYNSLVKGKLISAYTTSYEKLILRSIANMYRLGYDYQHKKKCFNCIKVELLPKIEMSNTVLWWGLKKIPTDILIFIFNIIMTIRN